MDIKIENGKIIFSENNIKYSFDAHGEYPRPSIMPAISVGGKHLSNRSEDIKIESIQPFRTLLSEIIWLHGILRNFCPTEPITS